MYRTRDKNEGFIEYGENVADVQDASCNAKNKRRISSIPSTRGRSINSPARKQAKGQGKEVGKDSNEALETEIERVLGAMQDKKLDLLASRLESKIETKIAELGAKFQNIKVEMKELKEDVNDSINHVEYVLKQDINCTWEYAVKNEQYSRKNNLRILGLDEEEGENLEDKFIEAIISNLNETIEKQEIEIIHRIGQGMSENRSTEATSQNRKPRPVIVNFLSHKTKTRILLKRRLLKGKPLVTMEDMASDLAKRLKEL